MSRSYAFCIGKPFSNDMNNIKQINDDFNGFKDLFWKNRMVCREIESGISLYKD